MTHARGKVVEATSLRKLLLDEEAAEVRKLPGAGNTEDDKLEQDPADDAGVGGLGLITEFGFAFLFLIIC